MDYFRIQAQLTAPNGELLHNASFERHYLVYAFYSHNNGFMISSSDTIVTDEKGYAEFYITAFTNGENAVAWRSIQVSTCKLILDVVSDSGERFFLHIESLERNGFSLFGFQFHEPRTVSLSLKAKPKKDRLFLKKNHMWCLPEEVRE